MLKKEKILSYIAIVITLFANTQSEAFFKSPKKKAIAATQEAMESAKMANTKLQTAIEAAKAAGQDDILEKLEEAQDDSQEVIENTQEALDEANEENS